MHPILHCQRLLHQLGSQMQSLTSNSNARSQLSTALGYAASITPQPAAGCVAAQSQLSASAHGTETHGAHSRKGASDAASLPSAVLHRLQQLSLPPACNRSAVAAPHIAHRVAQLTPATHEARLLCQFSSINYSRAATDGRFGQLCGKAAFSAAAAAAADSALSVTPAVEAQLQKLQRRHAELSASLSGGAANRSGTKAAAGSAAGSGPPGGGGGLSPAQLKAANQELAELEPTVKLYAELLEARQEVSHAVASSTATHSACWLVACTSVQVSAQLNILC